MPFLIAGRYHDCQPGLQLPTKCSCNDLQKVFAILCKKVLQKTQRNHFAHGDLDKDFIGLALLDLMYLEYVVYAMQMKHYRIEDTNIRNAINELFHLNFAL